MLNRDIFISHLLRLILGMDQDIVEILPHIRLSALYLRTFADRLLHPVDEKLPLDAHFLKELQDQAVILCQKGVEQMLLRQFLISVVRCDFLTVLDCLQRVLCKFIDIHGHPSLLTTTCFRVLVAI